MRDVTLGVLWLLTLVLACSKSTAPQRDALGATVSYRVSSMIPISQVMTISADGVVRAELVNEGDGSSTKAPWLQLSPNEIGELKKLLEPVAGFEPFYHDPQAPLDGPAVYIAVDRDGVKYEVSVYPAYYGGVPPELSELGARLHALFVRATQE